MSNQQTLENLSNDELTRLLNNTADDTINLRILGILRRRGAFNQISSDNSRPSTSRARSVSPVQVHTENHSNEDSQPIGTNIHLESETEKYYKRFNLRGRCLSFNFRDVPNGENPISWINNGISEILNHGLRDVDADTHVGVVLTNEDHSGHPLAVSFRKRSQLNAGVIMDLVGRVLQSNDTFFSKDKLKIQLDIIEEPIGYGRNFKLKRLDYEQFRVRSRGIIPINNKDKACLAYALALAIQMKKDKHSNEFHLMKSHMFYLKISADKLCKDAGVDLSAGATLEHVEAFQRHLTEYTVVIYNSRNGRSKLFMGPTSPNRTKVNLYFENNHFDVIASLTAAFCTGYFCEDCARGFNDETQHKRCPFICPCCHTSPKCDGDATLSCKTCRRDFRGDKCLQAHESSGLCGRLKRCHTCLMSYWTGLKPGHRCGHTFCQICYKLQPYGHLCYMQKLFVSQKNRDVIKNNFLFIFYDFEATQETKINEKGDRLHKPNLCVVQQLCAECITEEDISKPCRKCGTRQQIFHDEPVKELLKYIYEVQESFRVFALAHNMKGYDGCFILDELMNSTARWSINVIRSGAKLMSIKCGANITFIDSLNYMPMPLSKLPSAFKFTESKGYFPHFFNTTVNSNYVGPLPAKEQYGYDQMNSDGRKAFMKWYDEQVQNQTIFDMKRDLVNYCVKDVDILRLACVKFRNLFIEANDIDPFQQATTIASACNSVFRQNFLKPYSIGIIPKGGYRLGDNQSIIALKWLFWLQHDQKIGIQHAGNGREVRLKENIRADGFCSATNTVYMFHGCWFHGCLDCYPTQTENFTRDNGSQQFLRREHTVAQEKRIRDAGYNLVTMWECAFRRDLKNNVPLKKFIDENRELFKKDTLNPRDAFFGGRTNAVKLHHKCRGGEKIHYYDFCSLYPFVNKYGKYPVGHPTVMFGDEECRKIPLHQVEGLVKCTVLPPKRLYHPVLPYRFNKRLTFPLCSLCLKTNRQDDCTHTQDERKLSGTWVSDELKKAVEKGYKILEIFEIWQYKTERYNKTMKAGGLFASYVDCFLKIKQSSSGWPGWVKTDDDKRNYIRQYLEKEGIELKDSEISKNPGLRYISKLMLNSFWGKFGQRENMTQTAIIQDTRELYKLLNDSNVEVQCITGINDETVLVSWLNVEENSAPLRTINVVVAAYTTASARLRLYDYLDKLGRRVLYFDTDSILFTSESGDYMPPTGDFLGDFTDELESYGPDSYIIEYVSGGPKNYSFVIFTPSTGTHNYVCKVKGISLNYQNQQIVNFDAMKKIVCENAPHLYVYNDRKIARTVEYKIVSTKEKKMYRLNYVKRRRLEDSYDTLPFGYTDT